MHLAVEILKNKEAAWIFMQWGCCKEIMTRCTLLGGFAPMRNSSFADPRVKAKAKVGPGTTRHLETVKWVIDNAMATEPHMALWAGLSTNEIPTELGKLLTGQDYGGDAAEVHGRPGEGHRRQGEGCRPALRPAVQKFAKAAAGRLRFF